MSRYVITLSRDFASMGRSIAKELAARMGCEFYDRDIVEQTARRMGLRVSEVANNAVSYTHLTLPTNSLV